MPSLDQRCLAQWPAVSRDSTRASDARKGKRAAGAMAAQETFNLLVDGSSPSRLTTIVE